jgi:hypothetical protein
MTMPTTKQDRRTYLKCGRANGQTGCGQERGTHLERLAYRLLLVADGGGAWRRRCWLAAKSGGSDDDPGRYDGAAWRGGGDGGEGLERGGGGNCSMCSLSLAGGPKVDKGWHACCPGRHKTWPKFGPRMDRAGCVDPVASHRWSASQHSAGSVRPVWTCVDQMRRTVGDAKVLGIFRD